MANQKKHNTQYLALDCFTSIVLIFGKDRGGGMIFTPFPARIVEYLLMKPQDPLWQRVWPYRKTTF